MDQYTSERLILEAHRARVRFAEGRSRLLPDDAGSPFRGPVRMWMAGRLRTLADRLDGRPAPHVRVLQ